MINVQQFINELKKNDLIFSTGVPDSMIKNLCFGFENNFKKKNIIASNEGSAVGIAIGYYLSSKKIPIVYMQNSGLGNAINPLISLADKNVYKVPIFLIIGWRGEIKNNFTDEPQHITQGKVTEDFLKKLNIKYKIINSKSNFKKIIKNLSEKSKKNKEIVALLVRKNSFEKKLNIKHDKSNLLFREEVLDFITKKIPKNSTIVSTTGILSRELNELIKKNDLKINNLMCVGGMGHAISIANGIAINKKKKIFCFDGDGSITMHLGSLATSSKQKNLIHIVFNNFSHESVGGHDNSAKHVKFYKLSKEIGYGKNYFCRSKYSILKNIDRSLKNKKSTFIEILIKKGHRKNISRPSEKMTTLGNKFIKSLN